MPGFLPTADDNTIDPFGHSSTVWMQELGESKPLREAMHTDVSVAREHVVARLESCASLTQYGLGEQVSRYPIPHAKNS